MTSEDIAKTVIIDRVRNHYRPISVGENIFISHRDFCPSWLRDTQGKTIHIWRSDLPGESYSCEFVLTQQVGAFPSQHLVVEYRDGESLSKANVNIEEIAQFCKGTTPLLIHCTVGQTRSPTLALIAKVARGCSVYQALGDVMKANWETRAVVSNFCVAPIAKILEWTEGVGLNDFSHCPRK